jgi:hypothetical protein
VSSALPGEMPLGFANAFYSQSVTPSLSSTTHDDQGNHGHGFSTGKTMGENHDGNLLIQTGATKILLSVPPAAQEARRKAATQFSEKHRFHFTAIFSGMLPICKLIRFSLTAIFRGATIVPWKEERKKSQIRS